MKNNYLKGFGLYIIIFLFIIMAILISRNFDTSQPNDNPYFYNQLIKQLQAKDPNLYALEIRKDSEGDNEGEVLVTFSNNKKELLNIGDMNSFVQTVDTVIKENPSYDLKVNFADSAKTSIFVSLFPTIIIIIISIVLLTFIIRQMQGGGGKVMNFGKSRAKIAISGKNKITFEQVAGLDEEKTELEEIVELLKYPKKFVDIGARIPKGVLLVGPPGTGKTLLAKAVAGEAGVPFFSISGSDFVEMFVGVGASRVRDLFEQAKKSSPCLVFIDEIDAVGRRRGAGLGGGHDEREQTLNQLLVEMDGFGINEGVIVLAATNRPDILDPALLRPGRFDRRVVVGTPDVKGREAILEVHAKGKKISPDVDMKVVAQTTPGFTGADLENLLNEAALLAARFDKKELDMDDLRKAFVKVGIGTEKKSRIISDKEKRITAYHEAGHAILFEILSELDPVHIISIIPTGMAGGYTMPLPSDDKAYRSKLQMTQEIISLFGGRAAEEIIIKDITTGASNDIQRASELARKMVMRYGMSEKLGPIQFGDDNNEVFLGKDIGHARNYGEEIASIIDDEIDKIIKSSYNEAIKILNENIDVLHKTAKLLIEKEKITGAEFRHILDPDKVVEEPENPFFNTTPKEDKEKTSSEDANSDKTSKSIDIEI